MPVDSGVAGDTLGTRVPGVYMLVLADQCETMFVLDPRLVDDEDPESVAAYDVRKAGLADLAQALIERRAGAEDPVYVRRELVVSSNVVPGHMLPAGVPMFERSLRNREWMRQGSFKVTTDDAVTASDLWPPLTNRDVRPDDPLPDEWLCEPPQPPHHRP